MDVSRLPFTMNGEGYTSSDLKIRREWKKNQCSQLTVCGNFGNFPLLRFFVKSIFENVEVPKMPFLPPYEICILLIW